MRNTKQSKSYLIFKYAVYIGLILFLTFPLYWIVSSSFRTREEIMTSIRLSVIPKTFTLTHYRDAFIEVGLLQCFINSLTITTATVLVSIAIGILIAYAFSKLNFKGKRPLFAAVLLTQFIPVIAYIMPLYLIMSRLRLLNTYGSLVITYLGIAFPVAVVLLSNYLKDIPVELEEAALIDGCTPLEALVRIILPISVPGIVATAIFIFITIWQEYLVAVSFISRERAYTVSMALTKFQGAYGTNWGGIMAGAVSISMPAVIMFLCSRKLFINNLAGGVKE